MHLVSLYPYWINLAPRASVCSIPGPQHQLTHEPGRTQLPLPSFLECVNYNPALPDLLLNNVNHKKTRKRKKTTTTTTYKTNSKIQMNNNKIKDPENKPNQPKQSLSRQEGPPRTVLNSSDPPIHRQSGVVGQSAGHSGVRKHPIRQSSVEAQSAGYSGVKKHPGTKRRGSAILSSLNRGRDGSG